MIQTFLYDHLTKAQVPFGDMEKAKERILQKPKDYTYTEAKYLLAQYYYDSKQFDNCEKEILSYIEASTPHSYWLARSFVLLSDIYAKLDRKLEARQYLLSLKQNYQADDDIAGMIESRLENLKE